MYNSRMHTLNKTARRVLPINVSREARVQESKVLQTKIEEGSTHVLIPDLVRIVSEYVVAPDVNCAQEIETRIKEEKENIKATRHYCASLTSI